MPILIENPTLFDFQKYVQTLEEERGFTEYSILQKCLMLGEELGELCEVIDSKTIDAIEVGREITDILIFIFSIANRLDINMNIAFAEFAEENPVSLKKPLPLNSTFSEYQQYCESFGKTQHFVEWSVDKKALKLTEEIGLLFKSIRKSLRMKVDSGSTFPILSKKLIDIVYVLCSIGNDCHINLEKAFRKKEEINKSRTWALYPN